MAAKYLHMKEHEARIWDAYIAEYCLPSGTVSYDVRLGEGAEIKEEWPPWMRAMVKALSQKRLDVMAEDRWGITIFEIKRRAGLSCLGQLLGYEALMFKERGGWKPITLVAVCEDIEPDMVETFEYYKVRVVKVNVGAKRET